MKQAGKATTAFPPGLELFLLAGACERWTRSCENTKPSGNGPGSAKHVERTGDIVHHLGVSRGRHVASEVVERREKVLLNGTTGKKRCLKDS